MVNPQKENGYTAIANEIVDALAGIRIPGQAMQLLWVIFRKTYGWGKKEDAISLSQFCSLCKMVKPHICKNLDILRSMNIIITLKGNKNIKLYRFNKDFSTWKPLHKKVIITLKGNASLHYRGTTKETNTKDNIYMGSIQEKNTPTPPAPSPPAAQFLELYMTKFAQYVSKTKKPVYPEAVILPKIQSAIDDYGYDRLTELLENYMASDDKFYESNLWSLTLFLSFNTLNKLHVGNK